MVSNTPKKKKQISLAERDGLIDLAFVHQEIEAIIEKHSNPAALACRNDLVGLFKGMIAASRQKAEDLLLADGSGFSCAERLSSLQDILINILHQFAVRHIFKVENPSSAERMAVVAVGGYGRGRLAPGSDIDLLFLLPYKQTPWGESIVEYILYFLWDLNFKVGHATRDIDECIRLSKQDMTIRTSILEARYLCGDRDLFETLEARFATDVVRGTSAKFIDAKMAERDSRHKKAGGSRYLVEPNVKEGKGGLRDLQTLFWVAKYFYRVKTSKELQEKGVFNRDEYRLFRKSGNFLWAVRCHLHFLAGRAEERLSFDLQREMAQRLNYRSHTGLLDVERFMKHYFLVAKNVGDLTNILSAKLEEQQVKQTPGLSRLMASVRRRRPSTIKGSEDFLVENKRIIHTDKEVFKKDPVNFLRIFKIADDTGYPFHPDLLHLIARSLKLIDKNLRTNEEANRIFLQVLSTKRDPETLLRKMNESGILGRFIPDFGKVVAMMQFNMYHHYTVDEHTIRSIGVLSDIEHQRHSEDHPLAHRLIGTLDDRMLIYIALFLHDIAKGREEDHSIAGAKVAKRIGKRFKLKPGQIETLSWLVLEHLTMSITAQSRDLSDPKTIRDFANIVQTPERLKLLLVLTICDIRGVGPGVWNGWKGQLLRTLYYETQPLLTGGYNAMAVEERTQEAQKVLREALSDWKQKDRDAYVERHYPAYLLRTDVETQKRHADFIFKAQSEDRSLAISTRTLSFEGITEVSVYTPDQPNVLGLLAGACARAGAHIVGAQVYTTRDGFALDVINVKREFENEEDEGRRAQRIGSEIKSVLSGTAKPQEEGISLRSVRKSNKAFSVETVITIDNTLSNTFTVIEAAGKDRFGLLRDLAEVIFELNLNISSAHIATFGERAVDVFYVSDLVGDKIQNKAKQNKIKRRLGEAFKPTKKTTKKVA